MSELDEKMSALGSRGEVAKAGEVEGEIQVITKYELRRLLGSRWKKEKHKILDFSGREFKLVTLRGLDGGILNDRLDTSEIESIYLSKNKLTDLEDVFSLKDSQRFYSLMELDLSGNRLSDSGMGSPLNLPFLLKLDLSENNLTRIPDLSLLENLMNLDLSINNISSGGEEGPDIWEGIRKCKKLRILDLSYNNLNIPPSKLFELLDMFKDNLIGFSFIGNPLCEIFPEYKSMIVTVLPKLKYLDGRSLKPSQIRRNSDFKLELLPGYDEVFELRLGRRYDVNKMLKVATLETTSIGGIEPNHDRLDYLIEILECMMEEENSILLCSRFLQVCEKIHSETTKPWTVDGGGDLGDINIFESRRFLQVFSRNSKLPSERERETERFIELVAIALERQEKDLVSGADFCKIWLLTALARLMHIPVGGLAISISRLLANLMERKDSQNEISYIIGTFVLPSLKGRLFSDPIVQTVLACISILPQSRLLAVALRDEIRLILEYTISHVRTEFHKPLMSVLALSSLYRDNAIILSGYGVPVDLAGTLITLYMYSTPSNSGKTEGNPILEVGNQGESLAVLGRRETRGGFSADDMTLVYEWSSIEHIIGDRASDYVMRQIPASGKLGTGDVFSIFKMAKLLAKRRNRSVKGGLQVKKKETLSLSILPDFVKFSDFQQSLIICYLQIVRNCCLASKKVAASCTDLGLHSNFLMPLLSEFLSAGNTYMLDERSSRLCSEVIHTISGTLEASESALAQMVVNFHLIDWLLVPLKETPFGDPNVVSASTDAILKILGKREYLETMQNAPFSETFPTVGKSLNIFTMGAPVGSQMNYPNNDESCPVLNYIFQQLDYLVPKLEFLSGNQHFKELISKYCSNLDSCHLLSSGQLGRKGELSYSTLSSLEMLKSANSYVQKSIQSILDLLVFVFKNKSTGVCAKILEEIYRRGYCILFMKLLEVPSETIPASAIQILSMIDVSEMDLISIREFLRILRLEAFKRGGDSGVGRKRRQRSERGDGGEKEGEVGSSGSESGSLSGDVPRENDSSNMISSNVINLVGDEDENDSTFGVLGHFWMHLLTYIRRLVNNKGSSNWYIFRDTFSEDIGLIVFLGLKYSWNQFIMNSPYRLVVNHLSNISEFQFEDIYTILSSSRLIRALSNHDGFREHLRRKEIQSFFEYSLKKEEKYFAAFDPDTALEVSWCGRSTVWLLGTLRGQNRLSCSKKVATRILSRLADVLIGVSDKELYDLENAQLDKALMYQKQTSSVAEGLTSIENCFSLVVSRESAIWDLSEEPFVEQLLFLDEEELADKLEQEKQFMECDGITKTLVFLSSLVDARLKDGALSDSPGAVDVRGRWSSGKLNSTFSAATRWAGLLKGSIILKEKAVVRLSKVSRSVLAEENEDSVQGEDGVLREEEMSVSSVSDLERLVILSDSDSEILETAEADYREDPNEEVEIIHPRTRNILHGIYHKYGPLTTGSGEESLPVEEELPGSVASIEEGNSEGILGSMACLLSTEKCVLAQNTLLGTGKVWENIVFGSINNHLPISAYLRVVYVSLKSNTSPSLREYARRSVGQPYILENTAKLVLSCGLLESHVASKFLLILANIFETDPKLDALSMDRLVPLYIGFWFIRNILNEIAYILHQATRRHLQPEEQLLCTSFSRAVLRMAEHMGNIQFSRFESVQEYGVEKAFRFFFSPLLIDCLQKMILFDIQISIGSSHGTYTAHVPLMFRRQYSPGKVSDASAPETLVSLRETMRQCCSRSLSCIMEKSSGLRYRILEGFTYQSVFRHFPLRRSFLFELLEDVNTQHFGRGVELFLSYYYERNERVVGTYPCYVFTQTKEDVRGYDNGERNLNKKEKKNKGKSHTKGGSVGLGKMLGIEDLVDGVIGRGHSSGREEESEREKRAPKRCVVIITTRSYYVFERPDTVRNVASSEQYRYKGDPIVVAKREYRDLRKIVKSFLGDQVMMLGWDLGTLITEGEGKTRQKGEKKRNKTIQEGSLWKSTFYDILIFDKIEDRDTMLFQLKRIRDEDVDSLPLSISYDIVSRDCLGSLLRLENIRASQFSLSERLKRNELDRPKIDKLYSLRQTEEEKRRERGGKSSFFIIEDMLDSAMDYIFPPNRKSRFPTKPYPRAALLHDINKAELRIYVVTINSIYELEIDWRYWFCPESNMLETRDDLYLRREMKVPPEIEIFDIGIKSSKDVNSTNSGARVGLLNFLGLLDKIPQMSGSGMEVSSSQGEVLSQFQNQQMSTHQKEVLERKQDGDKRGKCKDRSNEGKGAGNNSYSNMVEANKGIISLKNFRSEHAMWYESKLRNAKDYLFKKKRVFRIHRLRVAQFGPLEEPEVKLVYQFPRKKRSKRGEESDGKVEKSRQSNGFKATSSEEDPLTESSEESESEENRNLNEGTSHREKKYMTRLTSMDLVFMDDSARERFKVGMAIAINELENSGDWKRRMVPVQSHPGNRKIRAEKATLTNIFR